MRGICSELNPRDRAATAGLPPSDDPCTVCVGYVAGGPVKNHPLAAQTTRGGPRVAGIDASLGAGVLVGVLDVALEPLLRIAEFGLRRAASLTRPST